MGLSVGTKFGAYEVLEPIGKGGMGEVFRARDTKLNRDVALKVLPDLFADDPDRLARFQREAEVLASLNHPNIAQIYGLEESGGVRALVLELVEGPTLADRIEQGSIPLDEAIAIARQITDALEAAHEAGIIHRDLKPANVKVREDGTVKVLDFGLAKALGDDRDGDPSESPTSLRQGSGLASALTTAATRAGVIMGTAAYMSPEQAKGKRVDKRADIWGFGAVFFEMLTGERPFAGEDVSETLAYVLTKTPDWSALPGDISPSLRTYLMRCLEKDPKQRVRDMGDLRLAMEGAFETPSEASAPVAVSYRTLPWAVAAFASLAAGLVAWNFASPGRPEVTRLAYDIPASQQFRVPGRSVFASSRDGRRFVYNTNDGLFLRSMDELDPRVLPGTEENMGISVFSPDGQSVAISQGGYLKRLALSGGAAVVICPVFQPYGAHWAPDGTIFFAQVEGIFRVPANGGTPELVIPAADGERLDAPELLPDGDSLLFTVRGGALGSDTWDSAPIMAASLASGERTVLIEGGSESGHLVYALDDGLLAVAFDAAGLTVAGGPVSMVEGVRRAGGSASANYGVADNGTLFYVAGGTASMQRLAWVDRSGNVEVIETIPASAFTTPRLSPDGDRVLAVVDGDMHVYDLASGRESRLTTDGATLSYADWTPSGAEVTYTSRGSDGIEVWIQPADGSGVARQLTALDGEVHFDAWAPDGRTFSAHQHNVASTTNQLMVSFDGEKAEATSWLEREYTTSNAVFSPDGRYVALVSSQTGQQEIFIHSFPGPGGATPVSVGGGTEPVWASSGALFYRRPDDYMMMVVEVSTDPTLSIGQPSELFVGSGSGGDGSPRARYTVTADGRRFLMSAALLASGEGDGGSTRRVIIVQNWVEELKERVPN